MPLPFIHGSRSSRPAARLAPAPPMLAAGAPGLGASRFGPGFAFFCFLAVFLAAIPLRAEQFDDINVSPQSLFSGETYHGYAEIRVLVENRSTSRTRRVSLAFPDKSYGTWGDNIRRITRTVSVAPGSQAMVVMWQPPLPIQGSETIAVEVDDKVEGSVGLPEPIRHMSSRGYPGNQIPANILVSRSFNFDEVTRAMQTGRAPFSAAMATGVPDSRGGYGMMTTAWAPDRSQSGPCWIELDYSPPVVANRVRIYHTQPFPGGGEILLSSVTHTNIVRISPAPGGPARSRMNETEFTFGTTQEPISTVRINIGSGGSVSIDAVELSGPSGKAYASAARASSEFKPKGPGSKGDQPQFLRAELSIGQWSEYWLSYTPYDAIIVSGADLAAAPAAVASALWRYTECGGNLVVLGGTAAPDPWRAAPAQPLDGGRSIEAGFGHCFLLEEPAVAALKPSAIKNIIDAANQFAQYWHDLPSESTANATFPVVKNTAVPVRSTVFIMLAFVVAIGPANLFILSRLKRRIALLWTIPAISLATCVIVFAYSLMREGVTPYARIAGVTILNQGNRRATTIGYEAFYCPLTPGQGLGFGFDTEVTPLTAAQSFPVRGQSSGTQRDVDWTQAQRLLSGWVSARLPAHFHLRASEIRRERLEVRTANGAVNVVNGFGVPIQSLRLADTSGRVYEASSILPGQQVSLSPMAGTRNSAAAPTPRALLDVELFNPLGSSFSGNAPRPPAPNTYIAELNANPFLENALGQKAESSRTRAHALVYGILDPQP